MATWTAFALVANLILSIASISVVVLEPLTGHVTWRTAAAGLIAVLSGSRVVKLVTRPDNSPAKP